MHRFPQLRPGRRLMIGWAALAVVVSVWAPGRAGATAGVFEVVLPPTNGGAVEFTAVQDGDWNDPATWGTANTPFTSGVPADGEIDVAIPLDRTVTVRGVFGATTVETVRVAGSLVFDATVHTQLKVDTIVVEDSGSFEIGSGVTPVGPTLSAEVIWDDDLIDSVVDFNHLGKGLLVFDRGRLRMHGSAKTPFVAFDASHPVGAMSLTVKEEPAGWVVGDEIAVAATRFVRSELQSENFRVRAITDNGNGSWTIDLGNLGDHTTSASLTFEHTPYPGMEAHVANLTRNVVFRSGPLGTKTDVQRRGHWMSRSQDVVAAFVECRNMGRTDKKVLAADSVGSTAGANQRGRYAFHFHRNQEFFQGFAEGTPSQVTGCVVNSGPGWGFVNHTSVVEFRDCVSWDFDGAGFVCEAGNEVGLFEGNIAMEGTGDPTHQFQPRRFEGPGGTPNRIPIGDLGFTGDGFWLGSPGVEVVDNVAAGFDGRGYSVWNQGLFETDFGEEAGFRTELIDWQTSGYRVWNDSGAKHSGRAVIGDLTFKRFERNTAYGSFIGLQIRFHHNTNRTFAQEPLQTTGSLDGEIDTEFREVTTWNNEWGFGLSYIHSLLLEDSIAVSNQVEDNIRFAVNSDQVMASNPVFQDFELAGYRSLFNFGNNENSWTIVNPTASVRGEELAIKWKGLQFFLPDIPLTSGDADLWPRPEVDFASILLNETAIVAVLLNDTSPGGESFSIESFAQGGNGSVTDNGDGTLSYMPAPGFTGEDQFNYRIVDASGRKNSAPVMVEVVDPAFAGRAVLDFRETSNVGSSPEASYSFSVPVPGHPVVSRVEVTLSATSGGAPADLRNQNGVLGLAVLGGDSNVWFDPNAIAGTGAEAIIFDLVAKGDGGRIVAAEMTLEKISRRVGSGTPNRWVRFSDGTTVSEEVDTTLAIPYIFSTPVALTGTRGGDEGIYQLQTMELVVGEAATPPPLDFTIDLTDSGNVSGSLEMSKVFTVPVTHPWVSEVEVSITATSQNAPIRLRNQNGNLGLSVEGGDSDVWFDANAIDEGPEQLIFEFVPRNAAGQALAATMTLKELAVRQGTAAGVTGVAFSAAGGVLPYAWEPVSTIEGIDLAPDFTFEGDAALTATRFGGVQFRQLRSLSLTMTFDGAVLLDDDGDGIGNGFEESHGLSRADPNDAMSDLDRNGLVALLEYGTAFALHGRDGLPKQVDVVNPGDGKLYPALEYVRLKEAKEHADFACDVTFDFQTFYTGPGATTPVSVEDNGDGTETVVERSNTAFEDAERQFLLLNVEPK